MMELVADDFNGFTGAMVSITRHFNNTRPWWRGQADKEWDLCPRLYRLGLGHQETDMTVRFLTMAKPRYPKCPPNENFFAWLFLMQHYCLPTRLLDWSESPLVALFFAVESENHDRSDAVLWALEPTELNYQQLGKKKIFVSSSSDVRQIFVEAFRTNPNNPNRRILSVLTEQIDLRHMVQQSAFTVHGADVPINSVEQLSKCIAKIVIPAKSKRGFRQILENFGVSRAVLFPDLENLSREITALEFHGEAQP